MQKITQRVIKFNQKTCLRSYIDINTELRKNTKIDFEKYFLKLTNNTFFGKTIGKVGNPRDIKLITTKARNNYLVS